jgi:hypothetical protein
MHEEIDLIYINPRSQIIDEMVAVMHQRKHDLVKLEIVKHSDSSGLKSIIGWWIWGSLLFILIYIKLLQFIKDLSLH